MTKQNGVRAVRLPMTLFPSPVDTLQIKGNLKLLEIVTGNPGVFQGYPYPYPDKPVPTNKGTGSCGLG
jgi:hypothetical protein